MDLRSLNGVPGYKIPSAAIQLEIMRFGKLIRQDISAGVFIRLVKRHKNLSRTWRPPFDGIECACRSRAAGRHRRQRRQYQFERPARTHADPHPVIVDETTVHGHQLKVLEAADIVFPDGPRRNTSATRKGSFATVPAPGAPSSTSTPDTASMATSPLGSCCRPRAALARPRSTRV